MAQSPDSLREKKSFNDTVMPDLRKIKAGFTVLQRHLRYAWQDPRKLWWIIRRIATILATQRLDAVLTRHVVNNELYANYSAWLKFYEAYRTDANALTTIEKTISAWPNPPLISILTPVFNPNLADLAACIESVLSQHYPHWELILVDDASTHPQMLEKLQAWQSRDPQRIRVQQNRQNQGISAATNQALALARGSFIGFLDQDDLLHPLALFYVAKTIVENPQTRFLYTDEDQLERQGEEEQRGNPHLKPDWDPWRILGNNYILHWVVIETALVRSLGGLRSALDGVQDWDLVLRVTEQLPDEAIQHIPHILYHWRISAGSTAAGIHQKPLIWERQKAVLQDTIRRRGWAAEVLPNGTQWRIRFTGHGAAPLVSIVIPTKDRLELLKPCLQSILEKTTYPNYQIILVDNGSQNPDTHDYYATLGAEKRISILHHPGAFNYARLCNLGVAAAAGNITVLLNNDIAIISPDWLGALVALSQQPQVGLVGGLLYYPNHTIQHAGVILGLNGAGDRPFIGYPQGYSGIQGNLLDVRCVSAMVTALAAVATERYRNVGGMDENLAIAHNDLDLSLKLLAAGYRNLITPFVEAYHYESASRGYEHSPEDLARAAREAEYLQKKWAHLPKNPLQMDPYYHPNLSLNGQAYQLTWPPSQRVGLEVL